MMNSTACLKTRDFDPLLLDSGKLHPVIQRVYAARGIRDIEQVDYRLANLFPPSRITHLEQAAQLLAGHLQRGSKILIFGDYDADGATSTALCLRVLRQFGHEHVDFMLPDRILDGYGVSSSVAGRIVDAAPDLVITVDTGIASFAGLQALHEAGIDVLVTDHHLPADQLPQASAIVNPNAFPDSAGKQLAGVGVAFYLMLGLRAVLREQGWFEGRAEPNLADHLDLVAIGTVADLAPLDFTNRVLVNEGLKRIGAGVCSRGVQALVETSGRKMQGLTAQDIGFAIGPRINAAGRLDDMSIGVRALLSEDEEEAQRLARELEEMNGYRRELQGQMTEQALALLPDITGAGQGHSHVLFRDDWHEGIVGIIASRIKDETWRPSIAFAPSADGLLKGSGRSIRGIHLRDMLDLVDKTQSGLIERFGGHAMAAGLTIQASNFEAFSLAFESVIGKHAHPSVFDNIIECDGELTPRELDLDLARLLEQAGPWGQGFPAPSFSGHFKVLDQRVLADRHLKFVVTPEQGKQPVDAICFYAADHHLRTNFQRLHLHYEMNINEFRGDTSLQLIIRHIL